MTEDTGLMQTRFGRYGAWARAADTTRGFARQVEDLGYDALWIGGSPDDDLVLIEGLLDESERIVVVTGVVNMWATDPATLAASYHRLEDRHTGRFVLGIGVGHRERDGEPAIRPYGAVQEFLDGLDTYEVPVERRLLAALGPRMLELAATRTLGAHPYMTTPAHTASARATIGPDAFLAPEQRLVITTDREAAMTVARKHISRYLSIANYRNNFFAMGYSQDDLDEGGSDSLISDLAAIGGPVEALEMVEAHLTAGADHVAIQVFDSSDDERSRGFRALAPLLRRDRS